MAPLLFAAGCSLPGLNCVVQSSPAAAGQTTEESLNCLALGGNKGAQISLAQAYETGIGLPRDMEKAVDWYQRAATPTASRNSDYTPPVDNQTYGRVQNIQFGTEIPGDAFAQFRLGEIYLAGDGVKQSDKRARRWLRRAARQDYAPAVALLAEMEAGE